MRNPGGFACITGPDRIKEYDTFTCVHCNAVVHVKPMADPAELGGFCRSCMKLICPNCALDRSCTPFLKKLEQMEARHRRSF